MGIGTQFILAAAMCAAVAAVVMAVKRRLLAPVQAREGVDVLSVIVISGEAEGLEETARGFLWLRETGRAYTDIIIAADGASAGALYRAEKLAQKLDADICSVDEISACMTRRFMV